MYDLYDLYDLVMLPGGSRTIFKIFYGMFSGLGMCYTDLAQHLTTAA